MNAYNSSGLLTQSRAYPIMSAHQECQFAERITRSCAQRSNHRTMFPSNLPLELGLSARTVFLNYQSRKLQRQWSRSRLHVITALLDNDRDNRVAANRCVVSGADDKIGVSQSSAERCFHQRKTRLRFIALLSGILRTIRINFAEQRQLFLRSEAKEDFNHVATMFAHYTAMTTTLEVGKSVP